MKRLVYSPRVEVYVKADSGIYDLSPYVTDVSVDRKINQVSTARVMFRNPDMMFTEYKHADALTGSQTVGPVFHPMDPIVIFMTRLRNRPIQVFTGYCDTTPYFQLFPGTCVIDASCTLKRIQYTYFDPGLPFFWEFMSQFGWAPNPDGSGIVNQNAESQGLRTGNDTNKNNPVQDSGIAALLMAVLTDVGGWNENNIYIENIPNDIISLVVGLFELFKADSEQSSQELQDLLKQIIGTNALGGGGGTSTGTTGATVGAASGLNSKQTIFAQHVVNLTHLDPNVVAAWLLAEEPASASQAPNGANNWLNIGAFDSGNWAGGHSSVWGDPATAGDSTAHWMMGKDLGFGAASAGIQGIPRSSGKPPRDQISTIQNSGWASSHYPDLPALYQQVLARVGNSSKNSVNPNVASHHQ